MLFLILFLTAGFSICLWLWRNYTYFDRVGLNHTPFVPLLGDVTRVMMRRAHLTEVLNLVYTSFPGDRLVGRYEFTSPVIVIKDPELVKKVTVKDFEHFVNRKLIVDSKVDPLIGRNLVALSGNEWKDMRSSLSPAFTSSKIRQMVPFMVQVGDQMITSIKTKIEQSNADYIDVDAKDIATRYANDVIATCVFGVDVNSQFEDTEFYKISKKVTTVTAATLIKFCGLKITPWLMKYLQLTLFPKEVREFYNEIVLGGFRKREEQNIHRPDMIHLLMEAKKGRLSHDTKSTKDADAGFATVEESEIGRAAVKREWSDVDLVAQAVIFLFAGFDTVSSAMSFLLYEMAVNPECQEKLLQEIRENEERNEGKFDYNSVQHMVYLDMVVSEVLRKWPGTPGIDRECARDYNLGKPNSKATKDVIIRKGDIVQVPVFALHHDPKHYPDPEKFDPERFSEANKHKIVPFTYMPFGSGPRNCIGSRFALCEVKVMAYQLLQHMEVSPCEKTQIPVQLAKDDGFRMNIQGGNWLRLRPRK